MPSSKEAFSAHARPT